MFAPSASAGTGGSAGSLASAAGSKAMPATAYATPEEETFSFFLRPTTADPAIANDLPKVGSYGGYGGFYCFAVVE